MVYEPIYDNLQIWQAFAPPWIQKGAKKFSQWRPAKIASPFTMAAGKNRFAPELSEKEVIELLENATPGSIKKASKYGVKIFQGKSLKTLFWQFKHPS